MFLVQAGVSCTWTNDSQRILLENFDAIHNSPSHLYYTALPFSPSSSWLHEYYTAESLQTVKVVEGLSTEWGMCSCTVLLNSLPWTLSYWNNTIAVGSNDGNIFTLDAITGSQMAVLSGHTSGVGSLTFSSDGISLISGSFDKTVKLWDVQTGGVIKTFHGHYQGVLSVSISADCTTIASGSNDWTLRLWNIEMGECRHIIKQQSMVDCVRFSPTDPQLLVSITSAVAQCWNIDGHKVGSTFAAYHINFSPDGTQFVSCAEDGITVQNINSGVTVAKFNVSVSHSSPCCFSPDGRLVAAAASHKICIWDITGSDPHLVETFVGHVRYIASLEFSSPSTLISASGDESVKFWQISTSPTDPTVINPKSTPLILVPTKSIAPEVKNSTIIPSGLDGMLKAWGILTGPPKWPLQTLPEDSHQSNIQLIGSKLILVWYADEKINIWDAEKGELLQTIKVPGGKVRQLWVSGNRPKVFYVDEEFIQVWDIWTGKVVDKLKCPGGVRIILVDDSSVWTSVTGSHGDMGDRWDFGISGPSSDQGFRELPDNLYLSDTKVWEFYMSRVKDVVTGKVVLQLPKGFGKVASVQYGGQYLVASFRLGGALILDLSHMLL